MDGCNKLAHFTRPYYFVYAPLTFLCADQVKEVLNATGITESLLASDGGGSESEGIDPVGLLQEVTTLISCLFVCFFRLWL